MAENTALSGRKNNRLAGYASSLGLAAILACSPIAITGCGGEDNNSSAPNSTNANEQADTQLQPIPNAESQGKIAFVEETHTDALAEGVSSVWVVNPDGAGLKQISSDINHYNPEIKFSPNGKYLLFQDNEEKYRIIDLEGNLNHRFEGGERSDKDLAWTPDSKAVLFGVYTEGLYRYDLNLGKVKLILRTEGFTYDHNPVMSPNLESIVYTHHEYGGNYYIHTISPDGERRKLITSGTETMYDEQLGLDWLDNENIVFKISGKNKLCCFNTRTRQGIEMDAPGDIKGGRINLSPEKDILAVLDLYRAYPKFIRREDLISGEANFFEIISQWGNNFAWSVDGAYFAVSNYEKPICIFDRSGKEYSCLPRQEGDSLQRTMRAIGWR